MRILLLGEFSRLHNSLKEGLEKLGHEVLLVGTGNGFKNYPADIKIDNSFLKNRFTVYLNTIFFKLFSIHLSSIAQTVTLLLQSKKLKNFDIVQLVHEAPINENSPLLNIFILKKIVKNNKKVFQLSAAEDSINVKFALDGKIKYAMATPILENKNKKEVELEEKRLYRFFTKNYKNLTKFLANNTRGIIAVDLDYHIPLIGHKNYLGLIPDPINIDKLKYNPIKIENKIKIFHGINTERYFKKGNYYFEEALKIIVEKYDNLVEVNTTKDLPYNQYIESFNNSHIVLDQVYSFDQGYNALEAMAKGKVVFTGAEHEFLAYYNLQKNEVCINALPNVNSIVNELEALILNPDLIEKISQNARLFIEKEHNYIKIAQKYVDVWNAN